MQALLRLELCRLLSTQPSHLLDVDQTVEEVSDRC